MKTKKEYYVARLNEISKEAFNTEQKRIATRIINSADDDNVDAIFQMISQRVKTGFVFDIAPEINHNCVAIVEEDKNLYMDSLSNPLDFIEHKMIIGENYDVLKNLQVTYIDRESGKGLVNIIYIDPPYHTESARTDGNSYKGSIITSKFVYRDKFTRDGWLNMMNERLRLAKTLLSDDGIIYISIDDREQAYLKVLCDELFGEDNFISAFPRVTKKSGKQHSGTIGRNHDYIMVYAKNINICDIQGLDGVDDGYKYEDEFVTKRGKYKLNQTIDYDSLYYNQTMDFSIDIDGDSFLPGGSLEKHLERHKGNHNNMDWVWRWSKAKFDFGVKNGFVVVKEGRGRKRLYSKTYANANISKDRAGKYFVEEIRRTKNISSLEFVNNKYSNDNATKDLNKILGKNVFEYTKPVELLKTLINMYSKKDAVILDFFAGSGTTGQAVMEINQSDNGRRQFVLVTNNENNIAKTITLERLYRVINGVGRNNEKIKWKYSDTTHSLTANKVRTFIIKKYHLHVYDIEKAKKILSIAEKQFKLVNEENKFSGQLDIYNELASLNPYREEK